MKSILERVFNGRRQQAAHLHQQHSALSSELSSSDIETYYFRVIVDCLRRLLVPEDSVEVGIKRAGMSPRGLPSYAAYVRLLRWDSVITPVLLQNLPVIDGRVRKVVAASVLLEHTHFDGIWFQAGSNTPGAPKALLGMPAEMVRRPGNGA